MYINQMYKYGIIKPTSKNYIREMRILSDFNKILAFQAVMAYLNEEEQKNLAQTLGMEIEEIEKRLIGKNKEDEFINILLLMDVCKNITGFDEGVSQLLSTATADLYW